MKQLLWDNVRRQQMAMIICDFCQGCIGTEPWDGGELDRKFAGPNDGIGGQREHECSTCKRKRHYAYDNFVDPLHAYH